MGRATNWSFLTLSIQGSSSSIFGQAKVFIGKKSLDSNISLQIPMDIKHPIPSRTLHTFTNPSLDVVISGVSIVAQRRCF